jgi:hypothetical protein
MLRGICDRVGNSAVGWMLRRAIVCFEVVCTGPSKGSRKPLKIMLCAVPCLRLSVVARLCGVGVGRTRMVSRDKWGLLCQPHT